jgi:hypothetical protein
MAFHQSKPIAIGMVGGGPDSGIGETHRIAMRIDNKCELVAGGFHTITFNQKVKF